MAETVSPSHATSNGVMPKVMVITALAAEAKTLAKVDPSSFDVKVCGVGDKAARQALEVSRRAAIDGLVSWGVCGALSNRLSPGDLLVPQEVAGLNGEIFETSHSWRQSLHKCLRIPIQSTRIAVSKTVVSNLKDKQRLADLRKADGVDMESAAVAKMASQLDVPFIVVRSVADRLEDRLPKAALFYPGDPPPLLHTIWNSMKHPQDWAALIRMGRQFNVALKALKSVAEATNQNLAADHIGK